YKPLIVAGLVGASFGFLARPSICDIVSKFQTKESPKVTMVSQDSRFSDEERDTMFEKGIGIPFDIRHSKHWIEYWRGDTHLNLEKGAYISVCMKGRYSQEQVNVL
ncbi:hypothetical protein HYS48_04080, partial [Candidatus Woesearchaeota archaeon]|nr:hypothetical protein [Candidatus Woesearchaeota archaeon]